MNFTKWEYDFVTLVMGLDHAKEILKSYGLAGWELVTVTVVNYSLSEPDYTFFFKRELKS